MTDKYELFSKKWENEFRRLSAEDRKKVLEIIVKGTMNDALCKVSTRAMIDGKFLLAETLYNDYVAQMDGMVVGSEEWMRFTDKLLSEIRVLHINFLKWRDGEGADDSEVKTNED